MADSGGHLTHLVTSVCSAPACPSGPVTGCVDCKYNAWDYTLVTPLLNNDDVYDFDG